MYIRYYLCIISILLFFACQQTTENKDVNNSTKPQISIKEVDSNSSSSKKDLLIFKKENKGEFWKNNVLQYDFTLTDINSLPIGVFDIKEINQDNILQIEFPNNFYKSKKWNNNNIEFSFKLFKKNNEDLTNSKVFIFPNDIRNGESDPCFACPHWMTELYSSMEMHALNYQNTKHPVN